MLKPTWSIPSFRCDSMKWWRSDCIVLLRQKSLWRAGGKPASLKASAALRKWMYLQHSATLSIQENPLLLKPQCCFTVKSEISSAKKKKKLWVSEDTSNQLQYWHTDATCQFGIDVCILHKVQRIQISNSKNIIIVSTLIKTNTLFQDATFKRSFLFSLFFFFFFFQQA